jgi:hypothetical protein
MEPRRIYRELRQSAYGFKESTTVKEDTYIIDYEIMSYILNILIYVVMILLDSLLKYFIFITVIDLSNTFVSIVLIYNILFMFIIYF